MKIFDFPGNQLNLFFLEGLEIASLEICVEVGKKDVSFLIKTRNVYFKSLKNREVEKRKKARWR